MTTTRPSTPRPRRRWLQISLRTVLVLLFGCGLGCLLRAAPPYTAGDVEGLDAFTASEEAKQLLLQQGFVVGPEQFKQIFAAYVASDRLPPFVTEDSVLHAYHVLWNEGVNQLEKQQAGRLRQFSSGLQRAASAKSRKPHDLYWDLAAFAAVGLGLQDADALRSLPPELRQVASAVVQAIKQGSQPVRVRFLGLPVAPERFHAASSYGRNEELRGYFAARQWYATCCFRSNSAAETERALQLALLVDGDRTARDLYEQLTSPYDLLLGPADDAGVGDYVKLAREVCGAKPRAEQISEKLAELCQRASRLRPPKINDQLLPPDEYERFAVATAGFRLLPPRRCPSAVLMHRTTDPLVKGRLLPSGLDFFAIGPLACEPARRALQAAVGKPEVFGAIASAASEPLPDSLHGQMLGVLRLLQCPVADQAPAVFRSPAWQDKQLWAGLGAWAEQRHTWAVHAKLAVSYVGLTDDRPGYVSPYPEFFRVLGELARRSTFALTQVHVDVEHEPAAVGQEVLDALDSLAKASRREWTSSDRATELSTLNQRLSRLYDAYCKATGQSDREASQESPRGAATLRRVAQRWLSGVDLSSTDRDLIASWTRQAWRPTVQLSGLATVCDRLATIAQKQLDRQPLDTQEVNLLRNFGKTLAELQFYLNDAYLSPRDDFPLVTPVFANPATGHILYAGVGRPEALYVIVEVDGRPVLHRGAVLTYREFTRPASEPLDDLRWREDVRAGKAPPPPAFTSSFRKVTPTEEAAESLRWQSLSDEPADQAGEASAGLGRSLGWALGGLGAMAACCVLTLVLAWQQRRRQTQGSNTKR